MARCDIEPNGIAKSCGTNEVSVKFRRGSRLFAGYRKDRKIIGLTLFGLRFFFFYLSKKIGKIGVHLSVLRSDEDLGPPQFKSFVPPSRFLLHPLPFACSYQI